MTDLGDLLVLMAGAHRSFRTLRAELRLWRHHERAHAAYMQRHGEQSGGVSMVSFGYSPSDEEPHEPPASETDERLRLWLARPDRLREESSLTFGGRHVERLLVRVGEAWWSFDEVSGAQTNGGSPNHQHGASLDGTVLDPAQLLSESSFEILGTTMHAGREAIRVRSTPSPRDPVLREAGYPGCWPQELLVDAERGVLLRATSLFEGEPFSSTEFVSVAFDEELADELFVFVPPAGEEVRDASSAMQQRHRTLPLHEAARRAPFTVYVPASIPAGWQMRVYSQDADARQGWPASVNVHYADAIGRLNLNISEQAAGEAGLPATTPDGGEWRLDRLAVGEVRLWEPSADMGEMPCIALADIAGTRVQITTGDLSLDALAELASGLVPAPTEPPSLAG
jgi:outer membrane lipoprotein-sorting protein